ncbi:MAG: hypothetical protein KY445_11940 [Armatimonadetes bacterium]|nr:hypothetical protein [Armatimonadota bacterium]
MSEFWLAEWEVPPNAVVELSAPAEVLGGLEWHGEKVDAKVRRVKVGPKTAWLFFQPQRENESNYLVVESGYFSRPINAHSWEATAKGARVVRLAAEGHQFSCARIFFLQSPEEEPLREPVMLWRSGEMVWFDADFQNHVRFQPPTRASKISDWDSPRLYRWLIKEWQNLDSELRFAHQWLDWSEEERRELLYRGSGGLNELIQVMEWALRCDPHIPNGGTYSWYLEGGSEDRFRDEDNEIHHDIDIHSFSPQLWALREFFIVHFFPLPALPMVKPPLCVQDFDELRRSHIVARVEKRTARERFEAASKLRQWLRGKVSEAEVERLLPF